MKLYCRLAPWYPCTILSAVLTFGMVSLIAVVPEDSWNRVTATLFAAGSAMIIPFFLLIDRTLQNLMLLPYAMGDDQYTRETLS